MLITGGSGGSGGGGDATDASLQQILTQLQDEVVVSGEVSLSASTISAMQTAFDNANNTLEANSLAAANTLSDILDELLQKIEAGEEVGLTSDAVSDLSAAIAALYAFPTDYPALGTQTRLDTANAHLTALEGYIDGVEAALGTDTGTPPTSGTGVRGWLRGIYDRLGTNLLADVTQSTPVVVTGSGAANGAVLISQEVKGSHVSLQFSGTFAATYAFEVSNDNITWYAQVLGRTDQSGSATASTVTSVLWTGDVGARYFRVRLTAYTSGTANVTAVFNATASKDNQNLQGGNPPSADAAATSGNEIGANSKLMTYNGSTWDRARSGQRAHSASNTLIGAVHVVSNSLGYTTTASATGVIATQTLGQTVVQHAVQVAQASGTVTAAKVVLEGSLGAASTWFPLATWDSAAGQALGDIVFVTGKPVQFIRLNVQTLTGTTPQLSLAYAGAV